MGLDDKEIIHHSQLRLNMLVCGMLLSGYAHATQYDADDPRSVPNNWRTPEFQTG